MIKGIIKIVGICIIISTVGGCGYITSKFANPNREESANDVVCSGLRNQITVEQSKTSMGSGQQILPTERAQVMKNYRRYNCEVQDKNNQFSK